MILLDRLIEYKSDTHSPQAHQYSHMRPHLPGPGDMKSGFGRTDNWHKGLVFDLSPLFWSGSVEYCRRPPAKRWPPRLRRAIHPRESDLRESARAWRDGLSAETA